jgi:hypothetical protein
VKLTTRDGKFSDERRIPGWHARAKFPEMTHRLRGDWPKEQQVQQAALIIKLPSDVNLFAETVFPRGTASTFTPRPDVVHDDPRPLTLLVVKEAL